MIEDFNLDFDDVDADVSDVDLSDANIPEDDSDEYIGVSHLSEDNDDDGQHGEYNPSFKANLYTKQEISAKIKEAEAKIQYYHSQEIAHSKKVHGIYADGELASVREAHRNVEKWMAIKRRWENETPKKTN